MNNLHDIYFHENQKFLNKPVVCVFTHHRAPIHSWGVHDLLEIYRKQSIFVENSNDHLESKFDCRIVWKIFSEKFKTYINICQRLFKACFKGQSRNFSAVRLTKARDVIVGKFFRNIACNSFKLQKKLNSWKIHFGCAYFLM